MKRALAAVIAATATACDPLRPARPGIVEVLIRDDVGEVRRLRAALHRVERTAREAVVA